MNDDEFIADRIAALEDSVRYFSSANKAERERWVVRALLENMNISHTTEDVLSSEQDPPDVLSLGGNFEIKEILDQGRKRHQEYKEKLEQARSATNPQDLLTGAIPGETSIQAIYQLCSSELEKLKDKYPEEVRSKLDLLFYVNLENVYRFHEEPFPDVSTLASYRWRSVSFVIGHIASSFYAAANAPIWLKNSVGHVQHKVVL